MPIDLKSERERLGIIYNQDRARPNFSLLVYGDFGTGKTTLLTTCPKPILIHSFDPGGTESIADEIAEGWILPNTSFEKDDPRRPTAFSEWEKEITRLRNADFFSKIGTFALDSLTTWSEAMMAATLSKSGRAGTPAQLQDYLVQMNTVRDYVKILCSLPCAFVCTGHIETMQDEASGRVITAPLVTGKKLKAQLPLLFDEVYVSLVTAKREASEYKLLTSTDGLYKARTRLGRKGRLDIREDPDIKAILKKVGYPYGDKPYKDGGDSSDSGKEAVPIKEGASRFTRKPIADSGQPVSGKSPSADK